MRTRLFSLWLLLSVAVGLSAYDFEMDGLCYNITNDTLVPYTVEVTHKKSEWDMNPYPDLTVANIPKSVCYESKTYSVTSIGTEAFQNYTGLTSITIPNSVTSIGRCAFLSCSSLTSITIPKSVTSIGQVIVSGCTNLTTIVVEADNPNYDSRNNCNAIIDSRSNTLLAGCKTTTIPKGVTSIGSSAFSNCAGLTSITIPNSVTSIGSSAFSYCTGLTSVTIPESVTNIEDWTFYRCTSLTSITIPKSVTSMGSGAFSGCTGLNVVHYTGDIKGWLDIKMDYNIYYPDPLRYAQEMYINGVLLTELVIPEDITTISYNFRGFTGLTSVTIPNSVTSIEENAFSGCAGLTSVTIPNSVTSIGGNAFSGCTGLDTIIIGNGITELDSQFKECSSIRYLQLGSGMKSIGDEAFYASPKLKRIVCYAVEPPVAQKNSFYNYNIHVQVPCDNLEDYETDVVWGSFKYIECIGADDVDTDGKVIITPSDNEVEIIWPSDDNADTYSLVITQDDKEVCTLVFNKNGQLTRIAFAAPAQNGKPHHAPAAVLTQSGYRFTVMGLCSGTQYAYAMDVKDKAGASINTYKGTFTTTVNGTPTSTEDVAIGTSTASDTSRKVFRDGQVYILRGDKIYTTMGVEVNE